MVDRKKELIKILKKERPKLEKAGHHVVIIEQKKVSDRLGMLRGEYYLNDKMEASGSLVFPLQQPDESHPTVWDKMRVGDSEYYAITADLKPKPLSALLKGFIRRSLEEGKIQDLLPFGRKKE